MKENSAVLKLRIYPDPVLRQKCEEVKEVTLEIKQLLQHMVWAMHFYGGVGLAGPQVSQLKRVIVVDGKRRGAIGLVNPKITTKQESQVSKEGCLSLPGILKRVKRAQEIWVEAENSEGEHIRLRACGPLAAIIQHEVDHLDGILIIDKVKK